MVWWLLTSALAGDPLSVSARTTVTHGEQAPTVTLTANAPGRVEAEVRCGSRTWAAAEDLRSGQSTTVSIDGLAAGEHACGLEVSFTETTGADGVMAMDLTVRSLALVELSAAPDDIDLDAGTLVVSASRALEAAQVTAIGAKGRQVAMAAADLSDPTRPVFRWDADGEVVVKLVVQTRDAHGFTNELTLQPWEYAIPHEDVVFASGSAEIPADQVPKLEAVWSEIARVVDLYGEVVDMTLYVAGYTDTVGTAASNRELSRARARRLAAWFVQRGFTRPVQYIGYGEDVPAVPTADEVAHPANRRAAYVVSASPPSGRDFPTGTWRPAR